MARAIDKQTVLDLIIEARRADPETGSFAEWLAEYLVEHLPTLTPPNEWVSRVQELDELYTKLQIVTGFTAEKLLEMFAAGYTLKKPDYSKHFEAMANLAESDPPNEPLTLEQLREMGGQPVYMPDTNCWALVTQNAFCPILTFPDGEKCSVYDWYEQVGPVYRRPPEAKDNNVPTNEPLTIEELREMDGEPVYLIVDDGYEPLEMWALIDVPEEDHIVLINNIGGRSAYYSDDDLERDHITVYRRPPEGEANG